MSDQRRDPGASGTDYSPVGLASAGDDLSRLGAELICALFSAGRTVRIHAMNNRATQAAVQRLLVSIEQIARVDGRVTIAVVTDLLVVNDVRLVVGPQHMGIFLSIIEDMNLRGVEEIDISTTASGEELARFAEAFFADPAEEDAFGALSRRVDQAHVTNIRVTERIERMKVLRETRIDKKSIQEESNKVMGRAVLFMNEVMRAVEQKHPIQVTKAIRLTQRMADIIQIDESVLLGLTSIKDYDEHTFAHSVNVCVLSMAIADRLGLPKTEIAEIGVAGLLHDIGKMHVPLSVLNKPDHLDEEEWKAIKRHPMLGVIELMRVRSLRLISSPLFVALQHHIQMTGTGYPEKPGPWTLHRHSRIVAVADVFDAMTTARHYRAKTLSPGKALRFIHKMSGTVFDPVVAKAFIQAMGVYPVGSCVELNTGDLAVVVRQNRALHYLHRPFVTIVNSASREAINLAERAGDNGPFRYTIVRPADDMVSAAGRASCFVTT